MSILVPVPRIKDMSGYRQLTPQEIEALREDMRQSSEWARAELKRRRTRLNAKTPDSASGLSRGPSSAGTRPPACEPDPAPPASADCPAASPRLA